MRNGVVIASLTDQPDFILSRIVLQEIPLTFDHSDKVNVLSKQENKILVRLLFA